MAAGISQGINGFGVNGANGAFPNMGFNGMGDMNQMMHLIQNGMPNPMMANFPNMMGRSYRDCFHAYHR